MQLWLHSNQWVRVCIPFYIRLEKQFFKQMKNKNQFLYENDCLFLDSLLSFLSQLFFLPFLFGLYFLLFVFTRSWKEKNKEPNGLKREKKTKKRGWIQKECRWGLQVSWCFASFIFFIFLFVFLIKNLFPLGDRFLFENSKSQMKKTKKGKRERDLWFSTSLDTWLILPVVICLSQRLSHARVSISFYTVKLRMAH